MFFVYVVKLFCFSGVYSFVKVLHIISQDDWDRDVSEDSEEESAVEDGDNNDPNSD